MTELTIENKRDLYIKLVEQFPIDPLADFGETTVDPRDTYDAMDYARRILEIQSIAPFVMVQPVSVGDGMGVMLIMFTTQGDDKGVRKIIFESTLDAEHMLREIAKSAQANGGHWSLDHCDYMHSMRKQKKFFNSLKGTEQ